MLSLGIAPSATSLWRLLGLHFDGLLNTRAGPAANPGRVAGGWTCLNGSGRAFPVFSATPVEFRLRGEEWPRTVPNFPWLEGRPVRPGSGPDGVVAGRAFAALEIRGRASALRSLVAPLGSSVSCAGPVSRCTKPWDWGTGRRPGWDGSGF